MSVIVALDAMIGTKRESEPSPYPSPSGRGDQTTYRDCAGASLYEYYFTDHLGSTRALYDGTDPSTPEGLRRTRALTAAYDYTPYGALFAAQNTDATTHLYTGHDWDPANDLYFAPYRYYVPEIARWTTRDPLGMVDGPNVYVYVRNLPTNFVDTYGLQMGPVPPWHAPQPGRWICANAVGGGVLIDLAIYGIDGGSDRNGGNAFRHCLAACRTSKACGSSYAQRFWDGREDDPDDPSDAQDLHNNNRGYCNAEKHGGCWRNCMNDWNNGRLSCRGKKCPPRTPDDRNWF